jgi:hypothetical protein
VEDRISGLEGKVDELEQSDNNKEKQETITRTYMSSRTLL